MFPLSTLLFLFTDEFMILQTHEIVIHGFGYAVCAVGDISK